MHFMLSTRRFGSLHFVTSYRLYRSLCLPILFYGSEVAVLRGDDDEKGS